MRNWKAASLLATHTGPMRVITGLTSSLEMPP